MRLLLDEMLGPAVAVQLRDRGFDVSAVVERADLRALADETVLAVATEENRVVVTRNVGDVAHLHQQWSAEGRTHAGIVMVTFSAFAQDRSFTGRLVTALAAAQREGLVDAGHVLYLRPATTR